MDKRTSPTRGDSGRGARCTRRDRPSSCCPPAGRGISALSRRAPLWGARRPGGELPRPADPVAGRLRPLAAGPFMGGAPSGG